MVAKRLKQLNPKGILILEQDGEATNLIESWKNTDKVIIVDATSAGVTPGTISRFDVVEKPLPADLFHYSTHSFSVADTLE
ncbi:MAG: hydrogenase maturation protease, partial [Thermodesulfobacteriota bacterium]